jgi:hypothetical protein
MQIEEADSAQRREAKKELQRANIRLQSAD